MLDEVFRRESVTWGDRVLSFQRPTLQTRAAFKEELERQQVAFILRKSDMLGRDQLADAIRAIAREGPAQTYAWNKPEWLRCIQDVEVFKRLMWHVLVQQVLPEKQSLNPWLTPDQMDKLWDDMEYIDPADGLTHNRLDDAYTRLMAPDPNQTPPPGTNGQAAASNSTAGNSAPGSTVVASASTPSPS